MTEPKLILNGTGSGPARNLCLPGEVPRALAEVSAAPVSTTVLEADEPGEDDLAGVVSEPMESRFGPGARNWWHLRTHRIVHAQPRQPPGAPDPADRLVTSPPRLFACGDHRHSASIEGALTSGWRVAEVFTVPLSRRSPR